MDSIVGEAERFLVRRDPDEFDSSIPGEAELMGHGCFTIARQFKNQGISGKVITIANTGYRSSSFHLEHHMLFQTPSPSLSLHSTRMISKYRPNIPIIAFTAQLRTARELNCVWGVQSIYSPLVTGSSIEEKARNAVLKVVLLSSCPISPYLPCLTIDLGN